MSDLVEVVGSGDVRASLAAIRDVLAGRLRDAEPKESAGLAKQLADVIARIDSLPGEEKSELDDFTKRRAARRAAVS